MDTGYTLRITTAIAADDYSDRIEVSYPCAYSCEGGTHRLRYDDADNGFTVFKILPGGEIQIRRRGGSAIVLRKGYVHSVDYQTPYGDIPMTFTLQSAECSLGTDGGRVVYVSHVHIDGEPQINRVIMELFPNERTDQPS